MTDGDRVGLSLIENDGDSEADSDMLSVLVSECDAVGVVEADGLWESVMDGDRV